MELDHLKQCINIVNDILPNSKLVIYTNGDLLNKEVFISLSELGVHKFIITCHMNDKNDWKIENAIIKINNIKTNLGIEKNKGSYDINEKENKVVFTDCVNVIQNRYVNITIQSPNFYFFGRDRMESVKVRKLIPRQEGYCKTLLE